MIILGPPPIKKSRSESDESAFLANSLATRSLSADSASLAGSSSAVICVPKTEVATALDAKLGTCKSLYPDHVPYCRAP